MLNAILAAMKCLISNARALKVLIMLCNKRNFRFIYICFLDQLSKPNVLYNLSESPIVKFTINHVFVCCAWVVHKPRAQGCGLYRIQPPYFLSKHIMSIVPQMVWSIVIQSTHLPICLLLVARILSNVSTFPMATTASNPLLIKSITVAWPVQWCAGKHSGFLLSTSL